MAIRLMLLLAVIWTVVYLAFAQTVSKPEVVQAFAPTEKRLETHSTVYKRRVDF